MNKIVIVNDDPRICESLRVLLSNEGHESQTRYNGQGSLEAFLEKGFDLVLLDFALPDIRTDVKILYADEMLERALGYDPGEMVGKHVSIVNAPGEMTPEETANQIAGIMQQRGVWNGKIKKIKKDDTPFWRCASASLFVHPEYGEIIVSAPTEIDERKQAGEALREAHDELERRVEESTAQLAEANEQLVQEIKDRRKAEEALRASEEKVRALLNATPDAVALLDYKGKVLDCNNTCAQRFNKTREEMLERCVWELFPPEVVKTTKLNIEKVFETGEPLRIEDEREGIWNGIKIYPVGDSQGNIEQVAFFARDITNRKQLEDRLIRSERLAATGELAVSLAHEINSPLQGITSLLNTIERNYKHDEKLSENVNLIKSGFRSIRDKVKKLLDLSRPGKEKKQPMNINEIIEDTVSLFQSQLTRKKVKVNLNLSPEIPKITASPQQLGQVFMNLINNAVESIGGPSPKTDGKPEDRFTGK